MYRVLVRHKVLDYLRWKSVFDGCIPSMSENGFEKATIFRNADNPNEVFVLGEINDVQKVRQFFQSEEVAEKMQRAGVSDQTDIYILDEVGAVQTKAAA